MEGITAIETHELSDKDQITLLIKLKKKLDSEGFETCWYRPFMRWRHPEWDHDDEEGPGKDAREFYITVTGIPKVAPFDFVEARVSFLLGMLNFSLTFIFHYVHDNAYEPEEFEKISVFHDSWWLPQIEEFLGDMPERFSLEWDVEYDFTIEDSLCGNFPVEEREKVLEIMKAIRERSACVRPHEV